MLRRVIGVSVLFVGLLAVNPPLSTAETGSVTVFHMSPVSTVTIRGSSNLSRWSCRSRDIRGLVRLKAPLDAVESWLDRVKTAVEEDSGAELPLPPGLARPQARLAVPVRSFECGNDRMNRDMYRALKADSYPRILFGYYSLERVGEVHRDAREETVRADLVGGLALAGQGRTIGLAAEIQRTGGMRYRVQAEKETRMSRFGVQPPSAFAGLIRARDSITLRFDISVELGSPGEEVPPLETQLSERPPPR